ncbi:DUF6629 family protein [Streptomyces sp. NPDC048257]|uniref:DUF6629 family protein n=1 Tax=Streptomyces sp. NPDC048257 TaxID=3365526 RepID=UPI0037139B79
MCWSATADLAAGTVVCAVAVVCVARVRRPRDLPVAALPLPLGAHQLVEAAVWRTGGGCSPGATAWAVIAMPLLAVWVPAGVLLAARPGSAPPVVADGRRPGHRALSYCPATRPVTAEIRGHTIGYGVNVPWMPLIPTGHLFATLGALLLGGDRRLRTLGVVPAAGAMACSALWRLEFASTWCAFAAAASLLVPGWVRSPQAAPPVT